MPTVHLRLSSRVLGLRPKSSGRLTPMSRLRNLVDMFMELVIIDRVLGVSKHPGLTAPRLVSCGSERVSDFVC